MAREELAKGSSISKEDQRFLGRKGIEQDVCCVCGFPSQSKHHHPFKSRIPKEQQKSIPRLSVCGWDNSSGCHGLLQRNLVRPRLSVAGLWTFFCSDEKALKEINERRAVRDYPRVKDGFPFSAIVHEQPRDESSEDVGSLVHALTLQFQELQMAQNERAYEIGEVLILLSQAFAADYGGDERTGHRKMVEYATESLGMSGAMVARHETYAKHLPPLPEARRLGIAKGYYAARAVKEGRLSVAEACSQAHCLSVSDFRASVWPQREKKEPEPVLCPACGVAIER